MLIPSPAVLEARPGEPVALPVDVECVRSEGRPESYWIEIGASGVTFGAADAAGEARGRATLLQLGETSTPLRIEDAPRYGWRGLMLDVARHFFGVEDVLRLIDFAALYKLNVLHLHLTDDQGWRIEIPGWPNLTTVGAETQVGGGAGGCFTAADYQRIVDHAAQHSITVVPEVDVPGHVNAALRAYPELWGKPAPEPFTTWSSPGHSLDVRAEVVHRFLGDVVAAIPGEYFHLGGDEVEGLEHEDYAQFMWDACSLVLSHGKRPIVWEEAGVAKLPAGTIVQHWSDAKPARAAAEQGLPLIMSPAPHTYLDQKYDDQTRLGLTWAGAVEVRDAYDWDPDAVIDGAEVVGVEAALWSETTETRDDLDEMIFPRLLATAEVGWSGTRDWEDFRGRLAVHGAALDTLGVKFHRSKQVDWS
ncbi:family 20 glycosylhydrolase [Solirubrobacter phytolaccae]|uniref:beta-N-acetylhexosaminidase n=1 Tax=Solirubrobacter phytolaccae TaxID=1404360 RepID=A0A9X3N913_9ACTN|nr:family 20 glycosylhydrolase [Solirubrobacter phytolaccae]MDA0180654.1 family 20 glycosylhydrolase [Solirubrobacter phytolaccae]